MKESPLEQSPNGFDQTPSLLAAKSAAREARKRLIISGWPLILTTGLIFTGVFVLTHHLRLGNDPTVGTCVIIASIAVISWPALRRRMGRRAGVVAAPRQDAGLRSKWAVITVVVALGTAASVFLFWYFHPQPLGWQTRLTGSIIVLAACISLSLIQVKHTGLWELLALPGPISAVLIYGSNGWIWLILGFSQMFIGTVFLIRWRRWIRSIPRETSETPESME